MVIIVEFIILPDAWKKTAAFIPLALQFAILVDSPDCFIIVEFLI